LADGSSRPASSPLTIAPAKALAIVELRQRYRTHAFIALALERRSGAGARAGLSLLSEPMPIKPVVPYEHAAPGDMIHIDTKKLGRIKKLGRSITGDRRDRRDAGWEFLFVAIDDQARLGFTAMHINERTQNTSQFLRGAVACYACWASPCDSCRPDPVPGFRTDR